MSQLLVLSKPAETAHYADQIGALFAVNKLSKINFADADNMEAHTLREYSRLHLNIKGQHVFAERDLVWSRMDLLAVGQVVYTIFSVPYAEITSFSPNTIIRRHDAILSYDGKSETNADKSSLRTKDSTVYASELTYMPDFFFRPRFKGRQASHSSVAASFRPSLSSLKRLFAAFKSGLQ